MLERIVGKALFFVALLVALCVAPFFVPSGGKFAGGQPLTALKVYDSRGQKYVSWESHDAVKFSLDQVVTAIHYLFAAAAAGMAFVGKLLIEPRVSAGAPHPFQPFAKYSLITTVVLWIASTVSGMFAHLYLAELGTMESFSIYNHVGIYCLFQLVYFGFGLVLFLLALVQSA